MIFAWFMIILLVYLDCSVNLGERKGLWFSSVSLSSDLLVENKESRDIHEDRF